MKKSQILAALALAFALGVVAPVAGVYAADDDEEEATEDTTSGIQQGDENLTTNSQKAAKNAVKEVKQSFSTIKTYDEDGDVVDEYTGAAAYGYIKTNASTLSNALDFVKNAEKKDGNITKAFRNKVAGYVSENDAIVAEINAITEVMDLFKSADDWDDADLTTAKATVKKVITLIDDAAKAETDQAKKDKLVKISHNLQEVVTDTQIQKLVDAEVAKGNFTSLATFYNDLTGKTAGTIDTEAKLNTITTAIKNGLGAANWSKYLRIYKLVGKIEDGIEKRDASDVTLDRWVAQLKNAANASGDETVTPADPDTTLKPGNTGLVGSAEGTATTVSIVAGLATALTALGAGVVVYRNARREK